MKISASGDHFEAQSDGFRDHVLIVGNRGGTTGNPLVPFNSGANSV